MKKTLLLFALLTSMLLVFGQSQKKNYFKYQLKNDIKVELFKQLQNGSKGTGVDNSDFESWNSTLSMLGLGQMPDGYVLLTGNPDGQKSNTAQNGSSAVHIESNVVTNAVLGFNDTLIGGTGFTGNLNFMQQTLTQGENYTGNLTSIEGYIRGNLLSSDTAIIGAQLWNGAQDLGVAEGYLFFGPDQISETYSQFTLTLVYEDEAPAPDSIVIFLSSASTGLFDGLDIGTLTAGSWVEFDNFTFNEEASTDPVAEVNPLFWNAGTIEIDANTSSGTFTLSNTGAGTLTVNSISDLSSSAFNSTFNADDVSLNNGDTYEFSFTFSPTEELTYTETFNIETNGGTLNIQLSGNGEFVNIANHSTSEVSVFPNPASNYITVNNASNMHIDILNILGETVLTINNAKNKQQINISELIPGIYFLCVNNQVIKLNVL
jgi:hypothetical protein